MSAVGHAGARRLSMITLLFGLILLAGILGAVGLITKTALLATVIVLALVGIFVALPPFRDGR